MLAIKDFDEGKFVFMATSLGTVKKTPLGAVLQAARNGIIAVDLEEGDKLVGVAITDGTKDILLFTTGGKAIRFFEDEVRPMGREAAGVRGVRLSDLHRVNSLIVAEQGYILTASENGYGKLTPLEDFPKHGRGGQGVIALQVTDRNGRMIGALQVSLDDEVMLMSQAGVLVRTPVKDISVVGRNTQGVRLIRLEEGDQLSGLERIDGMVDGGPAPGDAAAADTSEGGGFESAMRPPRAAMRPRTAMQPRRAGRGPARPTLKRPGLHMRAINFSPGPAALPLEVLEQAREEMLDWKGGGMSVMEVSHRGPAFMEMAAEAEADLRDLMAIPGNYRVVIQQGGATAQFAFVPMNLTAADAAVDYLNTGHWSAKAIAEARRYCKVHVAADAGGQYLRVPPQRELDLSADAAYVHYTPNETISGVEFGYIPETGPIPLVADMSSMHPVRADGRGEVRLDLRRRPKEHRPVGTRGRDRARGSARPGATRHADGVQLQGRGRRAFAAEHAADVRLVYGGFDVQVAEERTAESPRWASATASRPQRCTRPSTAPGFTAIRWPWIRVRG